MAENLSMEATTQTDLDIDSPYSLSQAQIAFYQENGFIKLKNVLSPAVLAFFGKEFTRKVFELNTMYLPMAERTTYQRAFLQVMNLWQKSELIKSFVFGKRLARIAAQLMQVEGVRLYHDQALYKEGNGGFTPWHADQYYWPLATPKCITAWIPLQAVPLEMGPLAFAVKSHHLELGRDLKISDESEAFIQKALHDSGIQEFEQPFELGEVSFHSGWTFHRAGENITDLCREVMTIIYMDKDMRLAAPQNTNQQADWDTWCPGAKVGEFIDTPLNPVIYNGCDS
jgi:ectoine hydroxylase-related dioxygenase (phytanoyl-CoA dioxygenase family)